jgi:hypothetical protein
MKDRTTRVLTLDAAVMALFLAYVFAFSVFDILSADTWLTLRTGQWIVENLAVPAGNFFSFTAPDRPWVEHKWLFDVGAYTVASVGGAQALVLVKACVVCLLVLFLVLRSRLRAANPLVCIILFLAVMDLIRGRLTERADTLSFLFLGAFLLVLDRFRREGKNRLYLLPLLQIAWTNSHGSFVLGPAILLVYILGEAHNVHVLKTRENRLKAYLLAFGAVLFSCLINPYGPMIFGSPLGHVTARGISASAMGEWQAPDFAAAVAAGDWTMAAFGLILVAGLFSFAPLRVNDGSFATHLALYACSAAMALSSFRFVPVFVVTSLPIIGWNVSSALRRSGLAERLKKHKGPRGERFWMNAAWATVGMAILISMTADLALRGRDYPLGMSFSRAGFPARAVDFMKKEGIGGHVFNSFDYGGYIASRLYPDARIFIDGRIDLYPGELFRTYLGVFSNPGALERVDGTYGLDAVLFKWNEKQAAKLTSHLVSSRPWVLVYFDSRFCLFVKKNIQRRSGLVEYSALKPDDLLGRLDGYLGEPEMIQGALSEADRLIRDAPDDPLGLIVRGYVKERLVGVPGYDCRDYNEALGLDESYALSYLLLGTCLGNRNMIDEAMVVFDDLLRLDDDNVAALVQIGLCHYRKKDLAAAKKYWERAAAIEGSGDLVQPYLRLVTGMP